MVLRGTAVVPVAGLAPSFAPLRALGRGRGGGPRGGDDPRRAVAARGAPRRRTPSRRPAAPPLVPPPHYTHTHHRPGALGSWVGSREPAAGSAKMVAAAAPVIHVDIASSKASVLRILAEKKVCLDGILRLFLPPGA